MSNQFANNQNNRQQRNSNQNPNFSFQPKANTGNRQNNNVSNNQVNNQANAQVNAQVNTQAVQYTQSSYLQEVTYFANQMKFQKLVPNSLTVSQAIEIILVADRFFIPRLDALKSWEVRNQSVVINAHFLLSVLVSQGIVSPNNIIIRHSEDDNARCLVSISRLSREITMGECFYSERIENFAWTNPYHAAEEVAIIRCLRNSFPQLTMNIISPAELPPSVFANIKSLCVSTYRFVSAFIGTCFSKEEKVPTTIDMSNLSYVASPNNVANVANISLHSTSSNINNGNSNNNSNIKSDANEMVKTIPLVAENVAKTISYCQEDLTLDVDDSQLQLKADSTGLNTSHIN